MKKIIITLQLILISLISYSQNINVGTETFNYGDKTVSHYGLGWYADPTTVSYGPMAYLSAYGGIRFFTVGQLKATLDHEGNLGIGVEAPTAKLDILNSWNPTNKTALKMFYRDSWGTGAYASQFRFIDIASSEGNSILQVNGYGIGIGFDPPVYASSDRLYVNGNVGIGTNDTKGYKFAVNGSAIATSMTIKEIGNWPDYVFKRGYVIPKLTEVDKYIKENGHLSEVQSAAEIEKNGISLGEMNKILLKKVEELTLYLIDKDKKDAQKDFQIKSQQAQIDGLRLQMEKILSISSKNEK